MSSSQSEPALIPDEVLSGLLGEEPRMPMTRLEEVGLVANGEPIGPLTVRTVRDLARELLACRASLHGLLRSYFDCYASIHRRYSTRDPTGRDKAIRSDFAEFAEVLLAHACLPEHAGVGS